MKGKITFRVAPHEHKPGTEIVEILYDGQVCGVLYPDEEGRGMMRLVSAHFAGAITHDGKFPEGVAMDTGEEQPLPIPALRIHFTPGSYMMTKEGIERFPR